MDGRFIGSPEVARNLSQRNNVDPSAAIVNRHGVRFGCASVKKRPPSH
jgi:hypothetical protein